MDGDGDAEAIEPNSDGIFMYRFNVGRFGGMENITWSVFLNAPFLVADLDQDGDQDFVAVVCRNISDFSFCAKTILSFENMDSGGNFSEQRVLGSGGNVIEDVPQLEAVDIDLDGDLDVVVAFSSDELVWFENDDGDFGTRHEIDSDGFLQRFKMGDLDLDGDLDASLRSFSF